MDELLSGLQLKRLIPDSVVTLQSHLDEYPTLDALLRNTHVAFILLEEASFGEDVAGHWVCILRRPNDVVYFDPYGDSPSEGEQMVRGRFREGANIQALLRTSGTRVTYDTTRFQMKSPDVATCGRWCALRAALRDQGAPAFRKWVISACKSLGVQPDELVVFLTDPFL
jgi:hypothetical protein